VSSPVPEPVGPLAERKLLKRLLRGDEAAYAELLDRYEQPLVNFLLRYVGNRTVAEDLFQETCYRMMRALDDYRPRAGFGTWLFTIARNLALDHLKGQRRHREVPLDAPRADRSDLTYREVLTDRGATSEETATRKEETDRIGEAIRRLSPKLRETLILRVYHGMAYRDIARITRAPVGTAKYRVHEAVQTLARLMGVEAPRSDI
jgi:RNA polymerase sigma-70 factor (ECF subfamily)